MARLCAGTSEITVRDNRGLDVRTLRYNRSMDGSVSAQYVDAEAHNILGQPVSSQDPRFFSGATLNFQYVPALSGQALQTVSVDAGVAKACADIAGRPIWQHTQGRDAHMQSDNDITVQLYYDALGRTVQRNHVTSVVSAVGPVSNTSDIWCYGDDSGPPGATYDPTDTSDTRNANLRGQLIQHFDTAGLVDMSVLGYAVQGIALRQDRRFLDVPCDSTTDWTPGSPHALYGLNKQWLEPDTNAANLYSTRWAYSALGQPLIQVDAKGHQQHTAYDCAGRTYAASVTPRGGTLTQVITAMTYTAACTVDTRSDANNIQVKYAYEPQTTQRLISITASRAVAADSAARRLDKARVAGENNESVWVKPVRARTTPLQALTYAYDGVGNVTSLSDNSASAQVSFFRNRAVTPDRRYTYDALYQLTSASGRENYVNDTPQGTDWPGGGQFSPSATPNYRPYTRSYTYDTGGNLTTIRSSNWSGATLPTRQLVVGSTCNRAVCTANNAGPTQANINTYFDPAGKNICLDANVNQPMYWTAFHQLSCVVTTYRSPTPGALADWSASDREQYAYDGDGQRVRKFASKMAAGGMARSDGIRGNLARSNEAQSNSIGHNTVQNTWNTSDTRYLPGLELRANTATGENLEVIVLDDGARILNWPDGAGKPSDIANLQLRYQYSDRQNSCQIETDSAGNVITQEEYYPYGGTAVLASRSNSEVKYKYIRYCGKERDATGLYYYGLRYYQPWIGRWINPDPAGTVDGQNLYRMVRNNPVTLNDREGLMPGDANSEDEQDDELLPLAELKAASHRELRLLEHTLELDGKGLIVVKDKDGKQLVMVRVGPHNGIPPPLWGSRDRQSTTGASIYRPGSTAGLHTTIQRRLHTMGLAATRTPHDSSDGTRSSKAADFYILRPIIFSDREVHLSWKTFLYLVAPLLSNDSRNEANSYPNVGKQAIKNPKLTSELAHKATLQLATVRLVADVIEPPKKYGDNPAGRQWVTATKIVAAQLATNVKELDFFDAQDYLFGLIRGTGKREDVLNPLKEALSAPAASSSDAPSVQSIGSPHAPAQASMTLQQQPRHRSGAPSGHTDMPAFSGALQSHIDTSSSSGFGTSISQYWLPPGPSSAQASDFAHAPGAASYPLQQGMQAQLAQPLPAPSNNQPSAQQHPHPDSWMAAVDPTNLVNEGIDNLWAYDF